MGRVYLDNVIVITKRDSADISMVLYKVSQKICGSEIKSKAKKLILWLHRNSVPTFLCYKQQSKIPSILIGGH